MNKQLPLILCLIAFSNCLFGQTDTLQLKELMDDGQYELAQELAERLLGDSPNSPELNTLYGMVLLQRVDDVSMFRKLGMARRGREALERAIEIDPTFTLAYKELSDYYYYAPAIAGGDKEEAARLLESIREFDPSYYYLYAAGRAMDEGGNMRAAELFESALRERPNWSEAFLQLGIAQRRLQNYEEAKGSLEQAYSLDPSQLMAYFHIGLIGLSSANHIAESIDAFKTYIRLGESDNARFIDQAYWRLGMLHELSNDLESARASYAASISLNPDLEEARSALEQLERNMGNFSN